MGVMMAIRWLDAHVRENNRQEAPTREQLQKLDCLKDLDLFETMCKILNIPMEVKRIWTRKRLMPWFRADMTAWLYEYAKKHMSKHGRVYSGYQLDIGAGAFKRAFVTHRNAVTTAVKRISRTSERSGKEKAEMLKEDLERNVTLCLHNSFCRNRESNVDPLPCRVSITGGGDGTLTNGRENKKQKERELEEFRSFRTSKRQRKGETKK